MEGKLAEKPQTLQKLISKESGYGSVHLLGYHLKWQFDVEFSHPFLRVS